MTTGDAAARNFLGLAGAQINTNSGDAITVGLGDGAEVIHQSNSAYVSPTTTLR